MSKILGIGVDVVDVQRMKDVLEKQGKVFLDKVFSDMEVTYCKNSKKEYIHFCAMFAAKEELAKDKRTGWSGAFHWRDIEVVNDQSGAPHILLSRDVAKALDQCTVHLSLSHTDNTIVAFVVLESKK